MTHKKPQRNRALYTKYRPQTFDDVVGQDHIKKAIQSAVSDNKVSHAYLFSGGRGIGKTTIARIIARELGTDERDIIEIDAASHTGVDDIREIRDGVNTLPFNSKYKVYILDEAHMLSKSAFNALLKTLEEPPAHVIFILATTEPEKIPDTIHSRCENHVFKLPSRDNIASRILHVAKAEERVLEQSSADLIALLANGSFRDGLGILQKVLSSSQNKTITTQEVERITGAPQTELVNTLVQTILEKDIETALSTLHTLVNENADMLLLSQMLLGKLRTILLLRVAEAHTKSYMQTQYSADDFSFLETLAKDTKNTITAKTITIFLQAYTQIPHAHIPSLPLELALIDILEK